MKNKLSVLIVGAMMMFAGVTGAYASETDSKIEGSVKNSYVYKNYLQDDQIGVKSEEGVVTLTGIVADESHKSLAEETAKETPGVTHVDNQIEIQGGTHPVNSDGWIGVKVKSALFLHRNVSGMNTRVDVKDGIVTLTGEATSQAQKDLTTEYAKDIEGVKEVNNQITIIDAADRVANGNVDSNGPAWTENLGENIDDASITAQTKMALLWNRSTSGLNTNVDTDNGVVTLTGKAKNQAEVDLATKLASDIRGVKSVINTMIVE